MNRMLIIGNECRGVKSVAWQDLDSVTITDYQAVLLDLNTYTKIKKSQQLRLKDDIELLIKNFHPVIYILPKTELPISISSLIPLPHIDMREKEGVTVYYDSSTETIQEYIKFIKKHYVVLTQVQDEYSIKGTRFKSNMIMTTNVKEPCGLQVASLTLLQPPEEVDNLKAIEALVRYISPDPDNNADSEDSEELEHEPPWVHQYEVQELQLQEKERELKKIERAIADLKTQRDSILAEKDNVAKWSDLLTKQGKLLEVRLKEAFELLGAERVIHEPNGAYGPDLVIEHYGEGLTIEVVGTKGVVTLESARELLHWLADAPPEHKGVLIANAFRNLDPKERPLEKEALLAQEALSLAEKRAFAVITTEDIFELVCKKLLGDTIDIKNILETISNTNGIISLLTQENA